MSLESRGEIEARNKLHQTIADLHGRPFLATMTTAALLVEGSGKRKAPVDTGRLRGSIGHEIRTTRTLFGMDVTGVVGTNVIYAAAVEFGSKPHWVPLSALEVWAKRHHMEAQVLQRVIARKGTKAHPYLRPAYQENRARVVAIIGQGVSAIVRK